MIKIQFMQQTLLGKLLMTGIHIFIILILSLLNYLNFFNANY